MLCAWWDLMYSAYQTPLLVSIVDSISACHAEDRGSIPRRGVLMHHETILLFKLQPTSSPDVSETLKLKVKWSNGILSRGWGHALSACCNPSFSKCFTHTCCPDLCVSLAWQGFAPSLQQGCLLESVSFQKTTLSYFVLQLLNNNFLQDKLLSYLKALLWWQTNTV